MTCKGFPSALVITTIIILAGISGQIYYVQKRHTPTVSEPRRSTDETANWKIYQNTAVGFELRYPQMFKEETPAFSDDIFVANSGNSYIKISGVGIGEPFEAFLESLPKTADTTSAEDIQVLKRSSLQLFDKRVEQLEIYSASSGSYLIRNYLGITNHGALLLEIGSMIPEGEGKGVSSYLRAQNDKIVSTVKLIK